MLTAAGAQAGVLRGLPCLLGVTTGMGVMMFVVPLGLESLVLEHPLVLNALHWGGAAFLLWLSERSRRPEAASTRRRTGTRSATWALQSFSGSTRNRGW